VDYIEWAKEHNFSDAKEEVKRIRAASGLSQAAFAKAYGIPRRTLENWESGANAAPEYVVKLLAYAVEGENK
jgi:putative transcriptional regulator